MRCSRASFVTFCRAGLILLLSGRVVAQDTVAPVIEIPQAGLDDPGRYRDYMTRFFRDKDGNPVQIAVNQSSGRVVHLWADGANESIGFTARDTTGKPIRFHWASRGAVNTGDERSRILEYAIECEPGCFDVGLLLLCSMRWERDFEYEQKQLLPFDSPLFVPPELTQMIQELGKLPVEEQKRDLALVHASNVDELQARLQPSVHVSTSAGQWRLSVRQETFDARNHLSLDMLLDTAKSRVEWTGRFAVIRSGSTGPVRITVRIGTDSPSLTPFAPNRIFSSEFMTFASRVKAAQDSLGTLPVSAGAQAESWRAHQRYELLDRQIRSVELLSFKEKLLAGLPNFATYFGRDMMMSAMMMESVWRPEMMEHVIASVLRKLSPKGLVSHEEALGGQAIRENAAAYDRLIEEYLNALRKNNPTEAASMLVNAREVISGLQATRENYNMVDETVQLPVLVGRYLARNDVSREQKRAFLLDTIQGSTNLGLLFKNLACVERESERYTRHPLPKNLVSFARGEDHRWLSGSWRDSGAGYANGRFAMDVNAIWMPDALEAIRTIFTTLTDIGISRNDLASLMSSPESAALRHFAETPSALNGPIKIWRGVYRHFEVSMRPDEARQYAKTRIASLPDPEKDYWASTLEEENTALQPFTFLALSLDSSGRAVPVINTDPATGLFLEATTNGAEASSALAPYMITLVNTITLLYPLGLFIDGVGPVVANDTYAKPDIWRNFERDQYHSPRVVWGREVNLFLLGAARHLRSVIPGQKGKRSSASRTSDRLLREAMDKVRHAIEQSGLKGSELWSYAIDGGKLSPARYAASCDIQLWNLTDLAVQLEVDELQRYVSGQEPARGR